jgi:hypothetical protein
MTPPLYTPSTMPVQPAPDPLFLFIRQAQVTILYRHGLRPAIEDASHGAAAPPARSSAPLRPVGCMRELGGAG